MISKLCNTTATKQTENFSLHMLKITQFLEMHYLDMKEDIKDVRDVA